jgi:hypothetical protein
MLEITSGSQTLRIFLYQYRKTNYIPNLLTTLQARATYYENETCSIATLGELENIQ